VIIDEDNKITHWWYSHDCKTDFKGHGGNIFTSGSGLKLMEHSWRRNNFVGQVTAFLLNNPQRLVWAGDYADHEEGTETNLYALAEDPKTEVLIPHYPLVIKGKKQCVGGGDFGDYIYVAPHADMKIRYAVNFDKKEFVAFDKLPKDKDGWKVHALPLLTAEGNGGGGGDYHNEDKLVGSWARDKIATCRFKKDIPKDFKEILPQFQDR
jgi:hypothetical protein